MKTPRVRYYVLAWSIVEQRTMVQPCITLAEARRLWRGTTKTITRLVEVA